MKPVRWKIARSFRFLMWRNIAFWWESKDLSRHGNDTNPFYGLVRAILRVGWQGRRQDDVVPRIDRDILIGYRNQNDDAESDFLTTLSSLPPQTFRTTWKSPKCLGWQGRRFRHLCRHSGGILKVRPLCILRSKYFDGFGQWRLLTTKIFVPRRKVDSRIPWNLLLFKCVRVRTRLPASITPLRNVLIRCAEIFVDSS